MEIICYTVNPFQENSYLVYDTQSLEAVIIDPGYCTPAEQQQLLKGIAQHQLKPVALLATHCHIDHVLGVNFVQQHFNLPLQAHEQETFWVQSFQNQAAMFQLAPHVEPLKPLTNFLANGQVITFGSCSFTVMHVPGHTAGHVAFYEPKQGVLFSGDVIFRESIGRTDLFQGNHHTLLNSINSSLLTLPPNTTIYPGHGSATTVAYEKMNNPFLTNSTCSCQ